MGFWQGALAFVIIATCFLLMGVILLQRGRGTGLAGAFGGAGGASAFGAKTGDVFTWITVVVAAVFILLSIGANFVFERAPVQPKPVVSAPGATPVDAKPMPIKIETREVPITPIAPPDFVLPVKEDAGSAPAPGEQPKEVPAAETPKENQPQAEPAPKPEDKPAEGAAEPKKEGDGTGP